MSASAPSDSAALVRVAPALFVFLWSTGYVGARFGLPHADPMTFTAIRFAIVAALLAVFVRATGRALPREPRMWGHLAVSGILIHAGFIGGIFIAIDRGTDIGVAALIAGVQPLLTAVLGVALLGEALRGRQWAGFAIGFFGLSFVVLQSLSLGALPPVGLAASVVALLGITLGTLYQKRFVVGIDLLAGSSLQFAAAFVPCAGWALLLEERAIEWNLTVILALVWLCFALSIGAISILLVLIRRGAASTVSSLFYLVPPVTAAQGYLLFDQRLTPLQLAGIAVTAIGVAMINVGDPAPARRR